MLFLFVFCRVVEHCCANAVTAACAFENIVVYATLATLPEGLVVGEFRKGNGYVTKFGVNFHYRTAAGESKGGTLF